MATVPTTEEKLDMELDDISKAVKQAAASNVEAAADGEEKADGASLQQRPKRGRPEDEGTTGAPPHAAASHVPRGSRRVYVSNLPWSVSWQGLKDFFRQAGTVAYASVMTEDDTGRSKGCGIVEFETHEMAVHAIETLHDAELDGRRIAVREDREDREIRAQRQAPSHGGGSGHQNPRQQGSSFHSKRARDPHAAQPPAHTNIVSPGGGGGGGDASATPLVGRRVFVGNLAWSTSWQDLKDYFRQAGTVLYASVMTEDDTGRSKGCGIVEFDAPDQAVKAIETLHDTELDGRKITVREDREDRDVKSQRWAARNHRAAAQQHQHAPAVQPPPGGATAPEVVRVGRRVYVGNLAWSTSWQDLKDFFRQAGNVVYASVMTEDDTGRSKGCGIVEFETSEEAVTAIETLHDAELDGRKITVREDREDKDLKGAMGGGDRRQRAKRSRNRPQVA